MVASVHSIETMGALDGPGLRCVIFLQGCPMRCRYCHNPDTWEKNSGSDFTVEQIVEKVERLRPYFGKYGGVLISGGEPFMQAEFVHLLLMALREVHINVGVDTCGFYLNEQVKSALAFCDFVILDIKHTNAKAYFELTGARLENTLAFLEYIKQIQMPVIIRQVILPGINDDAAQIEALRDLIKGTSLIKAELLPYHDMGAYKWEKLGIPYSLKNTKPPSEGKIAALTKIVCS